MTDDCVLAVFLDEDRKIEGPSGTPVWRYYSREAERLVKSWRSNAGPSAGCRIVAFAERGRRITPRLARVLSDNCVETRIIDMPRGGFMFQGPVAAMSAAAKAYPDSRIVYLDLDIEMKAPLPDFGDSVFLCEYGSAGDRPTPEFAYRFGKIKDLGGKCCNTYCVSLPPGSAFADLMLETAESPAYAEYFRKNVWYEPTDDWYFFEEGLYDYASLGFAGDVGRMEFAKCEDMEKNCFSHRHMTLKDLI